jgi:hypothetical protein
MRSTFIRVFAGVALVFTGFALVILTVILLLAFSFSAEELKTGDAELSPLSNFIVEHFRVVALVWWLYFLAAVIASVGLLRQRRWAHSLWVVLLTVAVLWTVAALTAETLHLVTTEDAPQDRLGHFPDNAVLSALVVIPTSLAMATLLVILLWKLLSHRRHLTTRRG